MKSNKLKILGIIIISASSLVLIVFGLYKFLEDILRETNMPIIVKWGIIGVILGVIIILISLVVERIKDYQKEK